MTLQDHDEVVDGEVLDDLVGTGDVLDSEGGSVEDSDGEMGGSEGRRHPMEVEDESIHSFEGHSDAVLAVAWSPAHPDLVASGGQDDKAYLWRVGQDALESTSGSLGTFELNGHTDTIASLAFSCQGTFLATGGMDGLVKVWDTSNGKLVQNLEGPQGAIEWVRWHPKGNVVLAGSDDMSVWMWLAQTGACMQVFSGHCGPVRDGCFSSDGKAVITVGGEDDCSLRVWNPKTGECTHHYQGGDHSLFHASGINCVAVSDAGLALTGAEDGSLRISSTTPGQQRILASLQGGEESVEAVGWSRHLPLAASAGGDGLLRVWDVGTAGERAKCEHPDVITRLAWHPAQPLVYTGCLDGITRCWDLRTGAIVYECKGHAAGVQDIAVSPDGNMVISGSDDGTAKVFSILAT